MVFWVFRRIQEELKLIRLATEAKYGNDLLGVASAEVQ